MKTYKDFIGSIPMIKEDTIAFSYKDGAVNQTVLINGSEKEIEQVRNNLPSDTKIVKRVPSDAMEIPASEWLKIK